MKKILITALASISIVACFPDDRNNFMVDDSLGLTAPAIVQEASVHTGFFAIGVSKNGIGQSPASVTVRIDNDALAEYNAKNNTSYRSVPLAYLKLENDAIDFAKEDVVKEATLKWDDAAGLAALIGDATDYVIPIKLVSKTDDVLVAKGKDLLLVNLFKSSVSVSKTGVTKVIDRFKVEPDKEGKLPVMTEKIVLDLEIDHPITGVGLTLPLKIDNSLIESFNSTQETPFSQVPEELEGLVTLTSPNVVIEEGKQSGSVTLVLNKALLTDEDGKLKPFNNYVIPVRVDKDNLASTRYGKEIKLDGLDFGNLVTYICINYLEIKPGIYISRVWGEYSTKEASWNGYFGGTAGSDRNVAMDDNNIYIAEFNSTKNLWAINVNNPKTVTKLPTESVESAGYAGIYLTCPRVIPNTDSNINGGKDVLVVSNLSTEVLKMYFYSQGIDKNPTVVNFNIWTTRRLGDTYSFWGTLQSGMFYFKDYDDATALMTFKQSGKVEGANSLQGRFVMPDVGGGKVAHYTPFPEDKNAGLYGFRDKVNSYYVTFKTDSWEATGGNDTSSTQYDDTYQNSTFQLISYNDKRYVAYTSQLANNDGRLIILEGEATDPWQNIVTAHKVVYEAAIQNDTELFGGPLTDDVDPSPKESTHSGMDLCFRQVGDDVYIAVVKQNVGLSLFRMTVIE